MGVKCHLLYLKHKSWYLSLPNASQLAGVKALQMSAIAVQNKLDDCVGSTHRTNQREKNQHVYPSLVSSFFFLAKCEGILSLCEFIFFFCRRAIVHNIQVESNRNVWCDRCLGFSNDFIANECGSIFLYEPNKIHNMMYMYKYMLREREWRRWKMSWRDTSN